MAHEIQNVRVELVGTRLLDLLNERGWTQMDLARAVAEQKPTEKQQRVANASAQRHINRIIHGYRPSPLKPDDESEKRRKRRKRSCEPSTTLAYAIARVMGRPIDEIFVFDVSETPIDVSDTENVA